jgi:hypothetical protein
MFMRLAQSPCVILINEDPYLEASGYISTPKPVGGSYRLTLQFSQSFIEMPKWRFAQGLPHRYIDHDMISTLATPQYAVHTHLANGRSEEEGSPPRS